MFLKVVFPPLLQQFWSVWNDCTHMYKSLVFGDELVIEGIELVYFSKLFPALCDVHIYHH